ncbi:DNA polymerase III subunit delta [Hydrogenimonas sp.]
MYKREFDRLLAAGELPASLMLYGDNEYELGRYAELYLERAGADSDGILRLYYDEYDFQRAKSHLGQSSLFGDTSVLLVRSDRKIPKKELTALIELAHKNPGNRFLYIYTGSDFKTPASAFVKKLGAEHVRFFPPNLREAADALQQEARKLGIEIDRFAIEHLATILNLDLSLAMAELQKLALLEGPVGTKEIDEMVFSLAPMGMDTLLGELFSRRPLAEILPKLHQVGEDEYAILRAIQYHLVQLWLFHTYIKLHGAPDSVQILGYRLPKHLEQQRAQQALKIPRHAYERLFDILAEGELAMKRPAASAHKETLLLSILIRIKAALA